MISSVTTFLYVHGIISQYNSKLLRRLYMQLVVTNSMMTSLEVRSFTNMRFLFFPFCVGGCATKQKNKLFINYPFTWALWSLITGFLYIGGKVIWYCTTGMSF